MSAQEFINYVLAKFGDTSDSHRLANRLLALLNYNPVLAKEALDATYHDAANSGLEPVHKDTPEWLLRYKGHNITLNHGLVLIDGAISDWHYNPGESMSSILEQVYNKIDDLVKEESLAEIRKHLSLAPAETKGAFNDIIHFCNL